MRDVSKTYVFKKESRIHQINNKIIRVQLLLGTFISTPAFPVEGALEMKCLVFDFWMSLEWQQF